MQIIYKLSDMEILGVGKFGSPTPGHAVLEVGDASALLDESGDILPGKTLADIPGAVELLKADIRARIDASTEAKILAGYTYGGVMFELNLETQLDFLGLYVFRGFVTFPFRVKGSGMTFLELENLASLESFASGGMMHKHAVLAAGWAAKLALDSLALAELAAYEVAG
jgi:hypothetical protein